jgi:hypothetical protein
LEALTSAQLSRNTEHRVSMSYLKHMIRWQESAHRRYLAAIKCLAQVRRLQSGIPGSQMNVQINVSPATEA